MKIRYYLIPAGLQQICIASPGTEHWSIMAWIAPFGFDTIMSFLSIVRAMRVSRKLKTPLTTQLIRDGERKHCCATMTMSDHLAGFGYYGYALLRCRYSRALSSLHRLMTSIYVVGLVIYSVRVY